MSSLYAKFLSVFVLVLLYVGRTRCESSKNMSQIWSVHGKAVTLNCKVPTWMSAPVMWIHPRTESAFSINHRITAPQLAHRMTIAGNKTNGEHNLVIKYVQYPDDVGEWKCLTLGIIQISNLSVIVAPREKVPMVNPSLVVDANHEAWTFTCSAQYAVPPVKLDWQQVSGPDSPFGATLPNYIISKQHHIAVTVRLIVTPLNFGSVFNCTAEHPSFTGVFTSTVVYAPPMPHVKAKATKDEQSYSNENIMSMIADRTKVTQPKLQLGVHDKISFLMFLSFTIIFLGICVLLILCRHRWTWNDIRFQKKRTTAGKLRCCITISIWLLLSLFTILLLGLTFPLYMRGITMPLLGTDTLMSVSAGSALWMDCGSKIQPIESLLRITWQYNFQPFYYQYQVNNENVGFPSNSTLGYIVGGRTKSYRIGQISVWPILPEEDGVYSCEVAGLEDNSGRTRIKRKSFGVFVVTGPYLNKALLLVLIVAVVSSILTSLIMGCHLFMCSRKKKKRFSHIYCATVDRQNSLMKALERPLVMGSL